MKSNLLFNRRKPGGGIGSGRNKFGKISSIVGQTVSTTTTTTESSTDSEDVATTTAPTQETEEEEEEGEKRPNIASRFKPSNRRPFGGVRPGLGFPRPPISFTNALLAKRKLRGGKKVEVETKQEEEEVSYKLTRLAIADYHDKLSVPAAWSLLPDMLFLLYFCEGWRVKILPDS